MSRQSPQDDRKLDHGNVDRRVGHQLRLRRIMLDISQSELGARCGLSGQQIHKYEIGTSGIRPSRLVQLSEVLDVPVSYFFLNVEAVTGYPDDLLDLLSDKTNSEILITLNRIHDSAFKKTILETARAYDRLTSNTGEQTPQDPAKRQVS